MLDFMVISLPRCASTWAANWLTTGQVGAVHDPLWQMHYRDLDAMIGAHTRAPMKGVCCTGLWRWPDFVNAHRARKLVLERPIHEVAASLERQGLPPLPPDAAALLAKIDAPRVHYGQLFAKRHARRLWNYLTLGREPFDQRRFEQLVQMKIEPKLDRVQRRHIAQ